MVAAVLAAEGNSLKKYIEPQVARYKNNRDHMLRCLRTVFPEGESWTSSISWSAPSGGFFLSLILPFPVDPNLLRIAASDYGVIFVPMQNFYSDGDGGRNQMRLSFSYVNETEIEVGLRRLSKLVRNRIENTAGYEYGA
jgi:(S)-3,5-dihydroxyphenylglycine transaminase